MAAQHHADDATLLAYAAGAVTEGFSLVIAAHLEQCPRCRDRVLDAEELGGELISRMPKEEVSSGGLESVWARIEAQTPVEVDSRQPAQAKVAASNVLDRYLPNGLEGVRWRTLAPGIRQHRLTEVKSGEGTVCLLSIAPGTTIPHHTHRGSELTLVLEGSFSDEIGRFMPGDLADLDSSVHHRPIADTEKPCICLIATDRRLKFSDALSRMLQPLMGI